MKQKFIPAYLLTVVNYLGFSIMIPVLPFVVKDYGAPDYVYGFLLSAYALFQYIGSPFLGRLSDSMGRKNVLMISHTGTLLSWFVFGIAYFIHPPTQIWYFPLVVIAFARIVDGLTGGNISVTNAYISDVSTPEEKTSIFGILGGIGGLAMIVGPGLGGITSSGAYGYLGTVLLSIVLSAVTLFSIYYWLHESLPVEKRRDFERQKFIALIDVIGQIRNANPSRVIRELFLLRLIFGIVMSMYVTSIVLFMIDRFTLDEKSLGMIMIFVGAFLSFNQVVVYKQIVARIGEAKTMIVGFICMAIGLVAITFGYELVTYLLLYFILNVGLAITMPLFNTIISKNADQDKQGQLMGISTSIGSLCNAIFPSVSGVLYTMIGYNVFYLMAVLPLVGAYLTYFLYKRELSYG